MKKILGILIVTAFMGSICFAQEAIKAPPAPKQPASIAAKSKTVVGKVVSVTVADPAKGITNGAISVVDEAGKTVNYTVSSVTRVIDNTFNAIPLKQLKADDKVKVKGKKTITGEEAQSITLLK